MGVPSDAYNPPLLLVISACVLAQHGDKSLRRYRPERPLRRAAGVCEACIDYTAEGIDLCLRQNYESHFDTHAKRHYCKGVSVPAQAVNAAVLYRTTASATEQKERTPVELAVSGEATA
jgi:hypothetical protein